MESVREMFDEMSLNVTAFLEVRRHPPGAHAACSARLRRIADRGAAAVALLLPQEHRGVSKLNFAERGPVTGVDLSAWESKSSGCALPEDLKALLQITDGLTLKWDANLHGAAAAGGRGARTRAAAADGHGGAGVPCCREQSQRRGGRGRAREYEATPERAHASRRAVRSRGPCPRAGHRS